MTALNERIVEATRRIVNEPWSIRDGRVVPHTDDIALEANESVRLEAVYMYADMADSSGLVRDHSNETAAKVIRAYLDSICKIIRSLGGEIRSFDGDRVMAIFIGDNKNSQAAKCALKIKYTVDEIVRPAVEQRLPSLKRSGYHLSHGTGIASGQVLITRGGVRANNDLVSVGRGPNLAAKLSEIRKSPYRSYLTDSVFSRLNTESKYSDNKCMWTKMQTSIDGSTTTVYGSSWQWGV